jgi:GNAT superfamily N-acetyltransferase
MTATRRDLPNILTVMDKAFVDDPTVLWVSDLPEVFANEHHRYVQMCAEPAFDHGGVHATTKFDGAAIWYPPGVGVSDSAYQSFKETVRFPEKIDGLGELALACDEYRPQEPHWTLELIAIDPAAQNQGVGSKLMAFGLAACAQHKMPVFLASSNCVNLPFYERLGFSQVAEVNIPGLPIMYPMIRLPSPG